MNTFMELMQMINQGGNPQQIALHMLESQMGNTPMGRNLLNLAREGKTKEIENIVRNIAAGQGLDYDKEFKNFYQMFQKGR